MGTLKAQLNLSTSCRIFNETNGRNHGLLHFVGGTQGNAFTFGAGLLGAGA